MVFEKYIHQMLFSFIFVLKAVFFMLPLKISSSFPTSAALFCCPAQSFEKVFLSCYFLGKLIEKSVCVFCEF